MNNTNTDEQPEAEQADDTTTEGEQPDEQNTDENAGDDDTTTDEPDAGADVFSRKYVEALRQENGKYRQRAQQADDLAQRLHTLLVEQTGKLQDASDLAYDEAHLNDPDVLEAAIDDLLARKPHLASRRVVGEIGQGARSSTASVDLAAILRGQG